MLCEQLGMHVNLACEIAELSIASAAFMQLAAVLPTLAWGVSLSSSLSDLTKIPRRNRQAMRVMIFRTSVCTTTDSAHSDQSDAFKHLCDTLLGQKIYHCLVDSG